MFVAVITKEVQPFGHSSLCGSEGRVRLGRSPNTVSVAASTTITALVEASIVARQGLQSTCTARESLSWLFQMSGAASSNLLKICTTAEA